MGRNRRTRNSSSYQSRLRQKSVLRRGAQTIGRHSNLNSKPVHVFLREREG